MSRQLRHDMALLLVVLMVCTGCHPVQPFFYKEDGDLDKYLDQAQTIDHPDVETCKLEEVEQAHAPLTISNPDFTNCWDLTLEECISIALQNSKFFRASSNFAVDVNTASKQFLRSLGQTGNNVGSIYDPASAASQVDPNRVQGRLRNASEDAVPSAPFTSSFGDGGGPGVEDALSEFDAVFSSSLTHSRTDTPANNSFTNAQGSNSNFRSGIAKKTAYGTRMGMNFNTIYSKNNNPFFTLPSEYQQNIEIEATHPILRGGGAQINRIPVVIARINEDTALTQFEASVRDFTASVEAAYWDLYFAYRNLEANKIGRDASLATWKWVYVQLGIKKNVQDEARARAQYFGFRSQVEEALAGSRTQSGTAGLFPAESNLRFLMGVAATDGRLIRPIDEPTTARVDFSWCDAQAEALYRSPEIRNEKWLLKADELRLIVAKNQLLPQLDVQALYRWVGRGDHLINDHRNGLNFPAAGSTAWDVLTEGDFQEASFGVTFTPPAFGARHELTQIRHLQLRLARHHAALEDMELALSHVISQSMRDVDTNYWLAQSQLNRLAAAKDEVQALELRKDIESETINFLLDAQIRRTQAQIEYYRRVVDYNKAIREVHYWKNSLLEQYNVCLAEGPWPEKGYWDALRNARQRDASYYLDYGSTRPKVVSRGPIEQRVHPGPTAIEPGLPVPTEIVPPTPSPTPIDPPPPAAPRDPPPVPPNGTSTVKRTDATKAGKPLREAMSFQWGDLGLREPKAVGTAARPKDEVKPAGFEQPIEN